MAANQERLNELAVHQSFLLRQAYRLNQLLWLEKEVKTHDEHDMESPIKPFPIKPYVAPILEEYKKRQVIFVGKSRQMMATWLFSALAVHLAQFFDYRLILCISKKQEDAFAVIERMRFIYTNQSPWLQKLCPLDRQMRDMPQGHMFFKNGSHIMGLAQGPDQVRMHTASLILSDESAFQDEFEATYTACNPSIFGGGKMVAFSSIAPGFFARVCEF